MEVFGNGTLDISQHNAPGVTTGSIEGSGLVFLGGVNLTVGTNDLSTTFSGVMQDGGFSGGTGGSLTKTGTGKLTLSGANTYTGGTTVNAGTLLVSNCNRLGDRARSREGQRWHFGRQRDYHRRGDNRHGSGGSDPRSGREQREAMAPYQLKALTFKGDATYTLLQQQQ